MSPHAALFIGAAVHDPFMAMSFLTLEVIPALKITDLGIFLGAMFMVRAVR